MADGAEWSSNANEAIQIRLPNSHSFQPAFSYAIFGEEESIFGYKNLRINLEFIGNNLKPKLSITWQKKYDQVGETKADDVEQILNEFLPPLDDAQTPNSEEQAVWEPPGELLNQYEVEGRTFGIWSTSLTDPAARELIQNIEILVLFFIEGASLLDLSDSDAVLERWRVFFVYEIETAPSTPNTSTYSLVGYSTAFRLYFIDPTSPDYTFPSPASDGSYTDYEMDSDNALTSHIPCRQRISQFLILPLHQHSGHGSHLYGTMVRFFLGVPTIKEITVEDPNESFDDLRDVNDILRLRAGNTAFASLALSTNVRLPSDRGKPIPSSDLLSTTLVDSIRFATKISPRQFSRLVEMQLLSRIPRRHRYTARITRKDRASDENDRAYYFWRLIVKQRLYKFNLDQLAQLDLEERIDKLEETLGGVERDYVRILDMVEKRSARSKQDADTASDAAAIAIATEASAASAARRGKKRKILDDDDEDEAYESGTPQRAISTATNGSSTKRTRTEIVDLASSEL